jgi:hypothetical protein
MVTDMAASAVAQVDVVAREAVRPADPVRAGPVALRADGAGRLRGLRARALCPDVPEVSADPAHHFPL